MKVRNILFFVIIIIITLGLWKFSKDTQPETMKQENKKSESAVTIPAKAVLAGGCFWCVESDFEKLPGVLDVVSGYSGGQGDNPNYKNYAELGHLEAVEIAYDSAQVSYPTLVEYLIRHSDPTDPDGSFADRGLQYSPAVYYANEKERQEALAVIDRINGLKIFPKPLTLKVLPQEKFWPAEEYHQNYSSKNPIRYKYYRHGSGRDAFIQKYWGDNIFPVAEGLAGRKQAAETITAQDAPWKNYVKPGREELKKMLTPIQYRVTQEEGTEKPFDNPLDGNKAEGIYVDILSGEPLYSSRDKYDSGTGWPSFVRPIDSSYIVEKVDKGFFTTRTEIRSKFGDNHIGHVFSDGPQDRGGLRYCMNSAALRFVPEAAMEKEGYGAYIKDIK